MTSAVRALMFDEVHTASTSKLTDESKSDKAPFLVIKRKS